MDNYDPKCEGVTILAIEELESHLHQHIKDFFIKMLLE